MNHPIITFTSDFGREDWYVGGVHGVIHAVCPQARVVDLSHEIPPGRVAEAAFLLEAAAPDFPPQAIHLVVVDPGVGTSRRALAVRARHQHFVGPDNGLLEWAFSDSGAEVRELREPRFFRRPVSRTFHGRDVFAPVAAHLARGADFGELGPTLGDPVRLASPRCRVEDGLATGAVMHVDRFGNGLTNITAEALSTAFPGVPESDLEVEVVSRTIAGLTRSYGDAAFGALVAILGSSGRLEISQVGGDASTRLGFGPGDHAQVRIRRPHSEKRG